MPAITIQSLELTTDQKAVLAQQFTALFSQLTHVPQDHIYVFFDGYSMDCAAKGGELFSSHPPRGIVGKFPSTGEGQAP